jgi:hypothetical protein
MLKANILPEGATNQNVSWESDDAGVATVSDNGLVWAMNVGSTVITVTTEDGGFYATCEVTVQDSGPGAGFVTVTPTYPSDRKSVSAATGIQESDIETGGNKLYLSGTLANRIAKELLRAEATYVNTVPIFKGALMHNGQIASVAISVKGGELLERYPFEVNLVGMTSKNTGRLFKYASKASDYDDGKFTILYDGRIYLGEINPGDTYELLMFIKDGGVFDLDGQANGEVISSTFIATQRNSSKDSGGCSASSYEYLVISLLFIPFIRLRSWGKIQK